MWKYFFYILIWEICASLRTVLVMWTKCNIRILRLILMNKRKVKIYKYKDRKCFQRYLWILKTLFHFRVLEQTEEVEGKAWGKKKKASRRGDGRNRPAANSQGKAWDEQFGESWRCGFELKLKDVPGAMFLIWMQNMFIPVL